MATWSQYGGLRSVISTQATTEAAPAATDGMNLDAVAGFTVYMQAASSQTFTGTGTLAFYLIDTFGVARAGWLDWTIPSWANGQNIISMPTIAVSSPRGRVVPLCSSVGVSAGNVTVYVMANHLYGQQI